MKQYKKILILGSGGLKIGQAGEFDYSGTQAIKALKEEGIEVVVINPNIATIQTSEHFADKIYFLPITPEFAGKVIEKEKPDGILLSFGGQTALNCGVELHNSGVLAKYNVEVLGTPVLAIKETEDRGLFVKKLAEINIKAPKSRAVSSAEEAKLAAYMIGYPMMIRVAYQLGGRGSGIAKNEEEMLEMVEQALTYAGQILIEEWLGGWKEIEYEVMRDIHNNCITVCNMENFDPLGIHTGESIVVAPSQTLTNNEYHRLRSISIEVIRHLNIVGECNIQFALDTDSEDYRVIEVNARLSRSSALASKATGYPLAFIAAKLALGYSLIELENKITKKTKACFEPALDYIVVKMPRWDLKKFRQVKKQIGSEMKSVGEVMAVGRNFEEAIQKAIRMLNIGRQGICEGKDATPENQGMDTLDADETEAIEKELKEPTTERIFFVEKAVARGISIDRIYEFTKIDRWFLHRIKNIVEMKNMLKKSKNGLHRDDKKDEAEAKNMSGISRDILLSSKKLGFSDRQIAGLTGSAEKEILSLRNEFNIHPFTKQIDTLAAEYPAQTNYLYLTYNGSEDDDIGYNSDDNPIHAAGKEKVIVLGSGPYCIGSSVEFDWCCVSTVFSLNRLGYSTIMINCNPETVSTDYDVCEKLYFEELSLETISEIYRKENPLGIIISMGGQIPNNLAVPLHDSGISILGTSPLMIDSAEDRYKFSRLLDKIGVDQPRWKELTRTEDALAFAENTGFPVLIRPSYVLSGAAMNAVFRKEDLQNYLEKAVDVSKEHPVVITEFITGAKEIEFDGVAKNGRLLIHAISEHVENAGVHSGDATLVLPPQNLYLETIRKIKKASEKIAAELNITGPFNIQFLAKKNYIKVIECNLRASRTFPFISKVSKTNFIDAATTAMMDKESGIKKFNGSTLDLDYVGVKAPQFSFSRLQGADPILGVEMASTGEVACFGENLHEAFLKSIHAAGFKFPKKTILLSAGPVEQKAKFLDSAKALNEMGYKIYASEGTSKFLAENGVSNEMLYWPLDSRKPNIIDYIREKKIDLVINVPKNDERQELSNDYLIRRKAVDFSIPLITDINCAKLFVEALKNNQQDNLSVKHWGEY